MLAEQCFLLNMLPPCLQSQQHISQLEEQLEGSQRQLAELHEEIEQLELSTAYTAYASTQVSSVNGLGVSHGPGLWQTPRTYPQHCTTVSWQRLISCCSRGHAVVSAFRSWHRPTKAEVAKGAA